MEHDLISFIIATYNKFDGVYDTLNSVFIQDYPKIEIIITDDGSINAEEELGKIKEYIEKNKGDNIKNVIINRMTTNQGTVKNLNSAIRIANGEYIKDLGADDTLSSEEVLSKYRNYLEKNKLLICVSKVKGVDESGKEYFNLASCEYDYEKLEKYSPTELKQRLYARNCLPAPGFFMKKELYEKYGYYDEDFLLIEDYPYWLHLCEKGCKIGFIDEFLIDYKMTGVSSAGHYGELFMKDVMMIYEKCIFPFDDRFGPLQNVYNFFKKKGLNTYLDLAKWEKMNKLQKIKSIIIYGPFHAFIKIEKEFKD